MTIQEVYEKYKHMDKCLCDKLLVADNIQGKILYDLWQAIRKEIIDEQASTQRGAS